jgi:hypothetical protein
MFRDENGIPNTDPQTGLHIRLKDFAIGPLVETYGSLPDEVFISSKDLCAYLNKAEQRYSMVKQRKGIRLIPTPGLTKEGREVTPPEEITPGRERVFQDDESKAIEESEQDDSSYDGSSSEAES